MSSHAPPARRVARLTSLAAGAGAALVTTPAVADVPEGWSNPPDVDALHAMMVLVGIPLALFVLISLAVLLPALARGEKLIPGAGAHQVGDQWLGGPRESAGELPVGTQGEPAGQGATGGARGSW